MIYKNATIMPLARIIIMIPIINYCNILGYIFHEMTNATIAIL